MAPPLEIAVIGAGPAGLTFASILHRKAKEMGRAGVKVPWHVTLYEAERSAEARRIGGSLDLGRQEGLKALEAAGLFNRFHEFARPEGQEIRLVNHHGDTVFHFDGNATPDDDRYSPEIDRYDLNRILDESLPKDAIRWDHRTADVRASSTQDKYEIVFTDGTTVCADIVVGADGAWSRVRPLLTDDEPVYPDVKATFLDIKVPSFNERFPELADVVGKGTLYSYGNGNMLVAQRNSGDVVHVYLGIQAPPDWRQHELIVNASTDRERVQTLAKAFFSEWGDSLRSIVMAAAESVDTESSKLISWPLYGMPVGIQWPHRRGATLLGDAAHLMSPCAGEGVNTAMIDAMELALALARPLETSHGIKADEFRAAAMEAVEMYEREMFKRVEEPARRSADNLALFYSVSEMKKEHAAKMFGPLGSSGSST